MLQRTESRLGGGIGCGREGWLWEGCCGRAGRRSVRLDRESYSDLGKLGRQLSHSKLTKVATIAVVDLPPMSITAQMATDKEGRVGDPYQGLSSLRGSQSITEESDHL